MSFIPPEIKIQPLYVVKMADGFLSRIGYDAAGQQIIHTTNEMFLAKRYTLRGAKMMCTKLKGVGIEQFKTHTDLTEEELIDLKSLIVRY